MALLPFILLIISVVYTYDDIGLSWGVPCTMPGPTEYRHPSQECAMHKGLQCIRYLHSFVCGCGSTTALAYDTDSGECRRKVRICINISVHK